MKHIAKNYLVPKQYKDNGVKKGEVTISDSAILAIIRHYTREAGVRGLEREISKICRKVIREHLLGKKTKTSVSGRNISKYLGVQKFDYGKADKKNQVGQVTGLAWTSVGGELLTIESVVVSGNGHVKSTGSLGKVMQESIQAAETVVKSRSSNLGISQKFLKKKNVHIHVPEGATPKDGPSAGVGMVTAIVSSMTGIPVKAEVAMTGGITLRGENYGIRVDGNRVIDPYGWGIGVEGNPGPNLVANNVVTGLRPGPEWQKAHILAWDSDQTWVVNNTTDGEWNTDSGWYGDVGSWGAGGPDNFDRLEFSNWELSVFRRIYLNNVFVGSYLGGVENYLGDWGETDTFLGNSREVPQPNPYDYHDDGAERFNPRYAFEDRAAGDYRLSANSNLSSSGIVNKTAELAELDFFGLPRSHGENVEVGAFRANPDVNSGDTIIEVFLIDGTVFRIED